MCFVQVVQMFDEVNRRWGQFIATYPWSHILASLVLISAMSVHLINLRVEHDIRASFSPANSKSMHENRVHREFFGLSASPQRAFILFSAKDNGSMLRLETLRDVLALNDRFSRVLKTKDPTSGVRGCDPLCELNSPFHLITLELMKLYRRERQPQTNGSAVGSGMKNFLLDYPISFYEGTRLFIGMNMIGVKTRDHAFATNNSKIVSAQTLVLWYFSRSDTPQGLKSLHDEMLFLFGEAKKGVLLEHVRFDIFGDEIANSEMVRGALEAIYLMTIGFVLLLAFVSLTVWRKMRHMSALGVAVVVATSVLCPLLASLASFGLLTWVGFPSYTIMCVTPFLIAGVGVDDAFIMLQSWEQQTSCGCSAKRRLSVVMVHVGPSITITSLTNTVAFGIGWLTPTPQMSLFCLCTSIAILIDYLLTFTLLCPITLLISPSDTAGESTPKSLRLGANVGEEETKSLTTVAIATIDTGDSAPESHVECAPKDGRGADVALTPWLTRYATFLHSLWGRLSGLLLLAALYAIATMGIWRMRSTFDPSKAFPSDSALVYSMESVRQVFNEFFPLSVLVNRPPNISNATDYDLFNGMLAELESLPESYGPNRTLLWLRPYVEFDREIGKLWGLVGLQSADNYTPSYDNLEFFLDHIGHPPTIKMTDGPNGTQRRLHAFQFTLIARNMAEWSNRAILGEKCRDILHRYSTFNATIHDGDSAVLNMLLTVKVDLIGSISATIACMIVICSFFIPNQVGIIIIGFTITSICYCLVGLISWWGADLDPVTLVDVLLATGFSVDYTAHVAHQFYSKRGPSHVRIAASLQEMGPPMLQAGFSTVLCMLPLGFVPTYAIVAFAKTVFVVVGVGLLHGLFFMPLMICLSPDRQSTCFKNTPSLLSKYRRKGSKRRCDDFDDGLAATKAGSEQAGATAGAKVQQSGHSLLLPT